MNAIPILLALCPWTTRQDPGLLDPGVRDLLHEELSGELAKEHVIAITRHHRIQGSRGYRQAAQYVLERLRAYGFDEEHAWIESFPSDGRVHYQTWQSPSGWDIESAELRMVEPRDERIVGYPEIAMSVITYSNPGDVTAELAWVGQGTSEADYEGKDVRGKLVLATGYGGDVHRLAVLEHGAAAVVCYLADGRAADHPDMLQYTGMWPKPDELERTTFGFNLTNRQGERLRGMLERGERVVLHGKVEGTGLEPYFMDVVVAKIDGTELPDEELVFSAHLDHPKESANDNASGSAAILDVARSLQALIGDGRLPRPRRTFRFLWVPEWYGTMAYVDAHPELAGPARGGKVLANMNLDMVGENTELLHSKLVITRTPASVPSVVNDVVAAMAEMVDHMQITTPRGSRSAFNYRITPYSGGSDHMMFLDRDVPAVMFSHAPDYTHHTSEDTPDKVDPVELERCELIATSTLWYLSELSAEQADDLVWLAGANARKELGEAQRRAHRTMVDSIAAESSVFGRDLDAILFLGEANAMAKVESVGLFGDGGESLSLQAEILEYQRQKAREALWSEGGRSILGAGFADYERLRPTDARVPGRLTRGPLAFDLPERGLPADRAEWYASSPLTGDQRFEIVNFIDGELSVGDICDCVTAEFGPVPQESVGRYLEDLVSVGVLEWAKEEGDR